MLTDMKIRNLKPKESVYRIADMEGLCIEIRPSGGKFWRYRYRLNNVPKMYAMGEYPVMSLDDARKERAKLKSMVEKGDDPFLQKQIELKQKKVELDAKFKFFAEQYYEDKKSTKSAGYANQIRKLLDAYILPSLGKMPISKIDTIDIDHMLSSTLMQIRKEGRFTGEVTVNNCRAHVAAIFNLARRQMRGLGNPVEAITLLERPPIDHAQDLTTQQLHALLHKIKNYNGIISTKGVMMSMLYSMGRTKEARFMMIEHLDIEQKMWKIPRASIERRRAGERNMKNDQPHIVPLSDQFIEIVKLSPCYGKSEGLVWPSMKNPKEPINNSTVNRALDYMGFEWITGHDFRATCSTMMNGKGYNSDHIEMQLAHKQSTVRSVYNHARYLPDRIDMLQWWADYLDSLLNKPLP